MTSYLIDINVWLGLSWGGIRRVRSRVHGWPDWAGEMCGCCSAGLRNWAYCGC